MAQYRGTSLTKNTTPLGPYSGAMPRLLGERAVCYERYALAVLEALKLGCMHTSVTFWCGTRYPVNLPAGESDY